MKFVLFHGVFGSAVDNWFPYLKKGLETAGNTVIIPAFPYTSHDELVADGSGSDIKQGLDPWMRHCEEKLKDIKNEGNLCFVGHSVGCLFILHFISKWNLTLDSAFFVAPFLSKLGGRWEFDYVNKTFYKNDFDFNELRKRIPTSYVFYSDNDPAVPTDLSLEFSEKLNSQKILVHGAKHFSTSSGFTEFPQLLEIIKKTTSGI